MGVPKNDRPQVGSVGDILWLGLIVIALLVVSTFAANNARGAECVTCRQFVRQSYAAPLQATYAAVPYQPLTMNFIGAPVRMQASQAYTMENAPEWDEFQAFKNFRAGYSAGQARGPAMPGAEPVAPGPPATAPGPPEQPTAEQIPPGPLMPGEEPPAPPTADQQRPYLPNMVVIAKVCGGCHGDKNPNEPDGGTYLNGMGNLRGPEKIGLRDDIMGRLLSQDPDHRMPRGRNLTDDELAGIVDELYGGRP